MQLFGAMGHLYAWASPDYMLRNMSIEEINAYVMVHCPPSKDDKKKYEPPDRDAFYKHYPQNIRRK